MVKLRQCHVAERDTADSLQYVHSRCVQKHILVNLELHKQFRKVKKFKNSGAEAPTTYQVAA